MIGSHIMKSERLLPLLAAALFLLGIGAGGVAADASVKAGSETPDPDEVTVFNAHRHPVQVFLSGSGEGSDLEESLLGTVGTDEVRRFSVPETSRTDEGTIRVEVQPMGPQPGLGQSLADSRKSIETYPVPREFDGVLKLIISPKLVNSSLSLVSSVR